MKDFYLLPKWILKYNISSDAKILYMYLFSTLDLFFPNDFLSISNHQIEADLHMKPHQRVRAMKELMACELIKRENHGRSIRTYVIDPTYKKLTTECNILQTKDGCNLQPII